MKSTTTHTVRNDDGSKFSKTSHTNYGLEQHEGIALRDNLIPAIFAAYKAFGEEFAKSKAPVSNS